MLTFVQREFRGTGWVYEHLGGSRVETERLERITITIPMHAQTDLADKVVAKDFPEEWDFAVLRDEDGAVLVGGLRGKSWLACLEMVKLTGRYLFNPG